MNEIFQAEETPSGVEEEPEVEQNDEIDMDGKVDDTEEADDNAEEPVEEEGSELKESEPVCSL